MFYTMDKKANQIEFETQMCSLLEQFYFGLFPHKEVISSLGSFCQRKYELHHGCYYFDLSAQKYRKICSSQARNQCVYLTHMKICLHRRFFEFNKV